MQVSPATVTIIKRTPTTVTICGNEYKAEKRILMLEAKHMSTQGKPFSSNTFAETTEIIDPKYWEAYIQRVGD